MVGQTLSQYRIDALLGAGGMGVVYRAHDLKLRRDVALKLFPDTLAASEVERARLQREAHAASMLNHANIAVVYDVGEVEGRAYIAMEFVQGQPTPQRSYKRYPPLSGSSGRCAAATNR